MFGGKVLSICIPTYNRPRELNRLLNLLLVDLNSRSVIIEKIEIIIHDNSEGVKTEFVVREFYPYLPISYLKHDVNIGPIQNLDSVVKASSGKYCWILGDDDLYVFGALHAIIPLLEEDDLSLLFMKPKWYAKKIPRKLEFTKTEFEFTKSCRREFLQKTGTMLTFTSSVIFRNKFDEQIYYQEKNPYLDSSFPQLYFYFRSINFGDGIYLISKSAYVLARGGSSGGYSLLEAFGMQLPKIFEIELKSNKLEMKLLLLDLRQYLLRLFVSLNFNRIGDFSIEKYVVRSIADGPLGSDLIFRLLLLYGYKNKYTSLLSYYIYRCVAKCLLPLKIDVR